MLDKLKTIETRYQELNQLLMDVGEDYQRATELSIERSELEEVVSKATDYRKALAQLEETRMLLESDDEEFRELAQADYEVLVPKVEQLENEIKSACSKGPS